MKKTMIILSALLALIACNKEIPQNEGVIDPSKVVFNFTIQKADDASTKGVKTGWENGDVVYVFFEDNTSQYVKMTYNGTSWTYKDNADGTEFSGLTLTASGKKLSAVYMPDLVIGAATPSYVTDKWTIGTKLGGYILKAESIDYTVTVESDVNTVNATFSMTAPANMMQIYINESELVGDDVDNEYVLNMTNVKPFTFDGIVPGGVATITAGTVEFPLPGYYGTLGSDAGYYFWGILDNASAGTIDYNFQLVKQNTAKKYAISSKSKTVASKNFIGPKAIKVSSLTDNGRFVDLGYGGPLWSTGHLKDDGTIVDPLVAGNYYKWCYTTPATDGVYVYNEYYAGEYTTAKDVAYLRSGGAWCMPSVAQLDALKTNTTQSWKADWTKVGGTGGGTLVKSKTNGISLFFTAQGLYNWSHVDTPGSLGTYGGFFSSTPSWTDATRVVFQHFANGVYIIYSPDAGSGGGDRRSAFPVRPVCAPTDDGNGIGDNFSWDE